MMRCRLFMETVRTHRGGVIREKVFQHTMHSAAGAASILWMLIRSDTRDSRCPSYRSEIKIQKAIAKRTVRVRTGWAAVLRESKTPPRSGGCSAASSSYCAGA